MNSGGGGVFSQVESALSPRSAPASQPTTTPSSSRSTYSITRTQEIIAPATIELASKTNALKTMAVKTNKPPPEPVVEPAAAPQEEWTPLFAAYVEPKDANNLWPIFLILLLIVLITELMRRHRRRRKRRFAQT